MDSDEEVLSLYSNLTVTSRTETTVSVRDSISKQEVEEAEDEDVFEDASSEISILTKRPQSSIHLDRSKMRVAAHEDLCVASKKVFEPLFLRKCPAHKVRQGTAPPSVFPMLKVEMMEANKKLSGHSSLLVSLDTPTFCVRYLASNMVQKAKNVLVYVSPMYFVRFVARPEAQNTLQSKFEDSSESVSLMMSPDEAKVAQKMLPKWQTVTFTLAFGKHVAVKFRIIEVRKQPITYVKARMERVKRVPTSTLYRTERVQRVEYWRSLQVHELKLSTVEKNDPQMVKKVFLEQQAACAPTRNPSVVTISDDCRNERVKTSKMKTNVKTEELNVMWQRTDS